MRKKFLLGINIIGIMVMFLAKMVIQAEESHIKSQGNIEGIINFYSEDIRYLEDEITKLLAECMED